MKGTLKAMVFSAMALLALVSAGNATAASAPNFSGIPDFTFQQDSGPHVMFADLRGYASDQNHNGNQFSFAMTGQSNSNLIDCYLQGYYYVSCNAPLVGQSGTSRITVTATSPTGLTATDSFNVTVLQPAAPPQGVAVSTDLNSVTIERGTSASIRVTVDNTSGTYQCFNTVANMDNSTRTELTAVLPSGGFCLANGQETAFAFTVGAKEDSRAQPYTVDLGIDYPGNSVHKPLNVLVSDDVFPFNVARESSYYVCNTPYTQDIRVRLENNTASYETITLSAYNDALLPQVEFPVTGLQPFDYSEMNIKVHTNSTTQNGEYAMVVTAASQDYTVKRNIAVRLVDCAKDNFSLSVMPTSGTIAAGTQRDFTVYIVSTIDKDEYVMLSSDSDVQTKLSADYILLPAHSLVKATLTAIVPQNAAGGDHGITVTAWDADNSKQATVGITIVPSKDIELLVENNSFDARACSADNGQVFEVRVRNNTVNSQSIGLSLSGVPSDVQASLSDSSLNVAAGGESKLYVFVNPGFDTPKGDYSIFLNASGSVNVSRQLNFRVVDTNALQQGIIQILSYPSEVQLEPGEKKTLVFTVANPLGTSIKDAKLSLYGTGSDAYFFPIGIGTLGPYETKEVKASISAKQSVHDKVYDATLEFKANGYVTTKPVRVEVGDSGAAQAKQENKGENPVLTAFNVLFGGSYAFLGVIIIIVLLALILVVSLLNSNKSSSVLH